MIRTVNGRKNTVLSKKIDTFQSKFGEIVNALEILISIDKIYDAWNEYDIATVTRKPGKYIISFTTDDDRSLCISRKLYIFF